MSGPCAAVVWRMRALPGAPSQHKAPGLCAHVFLRGDGSATTMTRRRGKYPRGMATEEVIHGRRDGAN